MNRVTWVDLQRQALHCPVLSAMFAMRAQGEWVSSEDALLWVALMLSEARIRALEEHAKTLAEMPPWHTR